MLARLQRRLVLGILLTVLGGLFMSLHLERPAWAWAFLLLPAVGYAAALGFEFLLMHRVNAGDPAQRASWLQVAKAWWRECHAGPRVFGWRQPFRSSRWPDRSEGCGAGAQRGVVLIHGFVCNRGLWNPWLRRLNALDIPHVAVNLEPVFGGIDDYMPTIEAAVARLDRATGLAPVVVAHSMGGLALRRWWIESGNDERVHRAITLGTPHHGTWLARFAMSPNGRQMQQLSEWLLRVAQAEPAGRTGRFVCFYSHCDNIVFPASTATLPGADNRHLPATAHVDMADHPEPWAELLRQLNR